LLQAPKEGGVFQYVRDVRNSNSEDMNFDGIESVLNDKTPVKTLNMKEGTLVLFRGLNSLHRVTPTIGNKTRILVVLAYNNKAGVSLSETARMTFFGRLS
jgi:predicted 2-oxoglutarate/Fe(II)-dependent dioxygenase YbiX